MFYKNKLKKGFCMNTKQSLQLLSCVGLTLLLPQCDWFGGQAEKKAAPASASSAVKEEKAAEASGDILVTIGGKVHGYVHDLDDYFEKIFAIQPMYRQFVETQPAMKKELAQGFFAEKILNQWVSENKVDQSAEYKKDLDEAVQMVKQQLAVKYFQEKYPTDVPVSEVRSYYEENKENPGIKMSEGGIATMAVKFSSEQAAQDFLTAVQGANVDFEKTAKDKDLKVKNYNTVSDKSFNVPEPVRTKVVAVTKFPSVMVVKADDTTWEVVKAFKKEEAQYVPFDQVKDQIVEFLKQQKMAKQFEFDGPVMSKIRKDLNVQINTDALDRISGGAKEQAPKQPAPKQPRAKQVSPAKSADANVDAMPQEQTA